MRLERFQAPMAWGAFLPPVTIAVRHPAMSGGRLAADRTPREWYDRAVRKVREYDDLVARAQRIANQSVRRDLLTRYHGDPNDRNGAWYARNAVASNVAEAEAYTPVNYLVFRDGTQQGRVDRLDGFVEDMASDVSDAEASWGIIPEPTVMRDVIESPLTVPILVGAGIVAAALLLT